MVVLDGFFFICESKKWSMFALDRWSSYKVTIVRQFAWADSTLVVLDEWLSYRGGHLNRFGSNTLKGLERELSHVNVIFISFQGYFDISGSSIL